MTAEEKARRDAARAEARALAAPAELSEDDEGAALGVELHLAGDRAAVRGGTVERAMTLLEALLAGVPGP